MAPSTLSQRILTTIAYCDQFEFPLTVTEIHQRLVSETSPSVSSTASTNSITSPTELSQQIDHELTRLIKNGVVGVKDEFYFLLGSEKAVATRQQRLGHSSIKWIEAREAVSYLSWIPWVRGVAVTGSLAMNNATQDDDIDFMIITQDNRLWLTRLGVIIIAWLKGKRRSWHREEKNSWCFNLWLEESQLSAPGARPSVYTAYEVCQAVFLLNRQRVEERFIWANHWVARYVPFYFLQRCEAPQADMGRVNWLSLALLLTEHFTSWPFMLLNEVAWYGQRLYMHPHKTREVVTRSLAFFHPRDTQQLVEQRWQTALK